MKKLIGLILCLVLVFGFSACTSGENIYQTNSSAQLSPEEQYNEANSLISEKKYREAIEILENIDYENSQELKKSLSYCYACELFNKRDFSSAYNYFEKSDGYLDAKRNMSMSAYYAGVDAVNADQHWKSIDWFRKTLDDNRFKSAAEKHIIEVTTSLLGAAWIGSYTNSSGNTLQVEFKYFRSKDNLYIAHADTSDGYRFIASITGSLEVGAEKCKYYHSETRYGGTWDAIEVSFSSSNRMYVSCDSSTIGEAIDGYYTAKSAAFSSYKIENVEYPTLNVPTIDANGEIGNVEEDTDINANNSLNSSHTHVYSKATCTEAQICESCGEMGGAALGHNWKGANCTSPAICKTCGTKNGTALWHNWKSATVAAPKTCKTCGLTEGWWLPENYNINVVYKSKTSTNQACRIKLGDYTLSYEDYFGEKEVMININATIETIGSNKYLTSAGVLLKFYDKNGKVLSSAPFTYSPSFDLYVGAKVELSHEIPEGTKKIEIYDYAQWP